MYENDPRPRPVPVAAQQRRSSMENIQMLGTVAEVIPAREKNVGPTSDADRLLRMLPDGLMLGVYRSQTEEQYAWQPVVWLALPRANEQTMVRSTRFREYLASLFYARGGKVLKDTRREELIFVICGMIHAAKERRDADYVERWYRDRAAAARADAHEAEAIASQAVTGGDE
jgi:hypothetical protein